MSRKKAKRPMGSDTPKVKKAKKRTPKAPVYSQVAKCIPELLTGRVLAIDPSIGSGSSMPGYSVFEAGELIDWGTLEIESVNESAAHRLRELGHILRSEFRNIDVLVIEDVPPVRGGVGRSKWAMIGAAKSVASLMKGVGAAISNVEWKHIVEIHPRTWQARVEGGWKRSAKSDAEDSKQIGLAAIEIAKELM